MKLRLVLIPLYAILLPACGDQAIPYEAPPQYQTNAGYAFGFADLGSLAEHDLCEIYDDAVEDAAIALWKYGVSPEEVRQLARSYRVTVIDHFLFPTPASPTGYAAGWIAPDFKAMKLALYSRQRNASGPSWTRFTWPSTGETHSGIAPKWLPAMAHEMGHHWFGANFGHGWLPPVVNGRAVAGSPEPDWSGWCEVGD